jgi:hypothetical protein
MSEVVFVVPRQQTTAASATAIQAQSTTQDVLTPFDKPPTDEQEANATILVGFNCLQRRASPTAALISCHVRVDCQLKRTSEEDGRGHM